MKAQLRPYDTSDTAALLDLFRDTVLSVNSKDYPQEQLAAWAPPLPDLKKKQARFKNSKTVVAQLDNKIVGFGNLSSDLTSIGMLYVHKDHLKDKIGTRILNSLEKKLIKREVKTAVADVNITAKPFFEKSGYHVLKENKKNLNGIEFLSYTMEKDLTTKGNVMPKEEKQKSERKKVIILRPFRWRDLFINKFFDLLMVIIGVSAAFQLENLKVASDHKSIETFYLESMLGDLRKDHEAITRIVGELKKDQHGLNNYIAKMRTPDYPADSLGPALFNVLSMETITFNQNTYKMLESSNGLTEFSDRNLRAMTTAYYNAYTSILRFEDVYTNVLFSINGYFIPFVDLGERKILDATIVTKPETRNWLLLTNSQLNDGMEDYSETLGKNEALARAIESRLLNR